jgi:Cu/Zn superoxide dismutase
MKRKSPRWYLSAILILLILSMFFLVSCISQGTRTSAVYDAGAGDLTMTGDQVGKIALFRFDTDVSQRTLTTPTAADIVAQFSSPIVGDLTSLAVTADGSHAVTVSGSTNVTVKASASTIAGNTTRIIILVLNNVTKGSEAVTIY